MLCANSTITTLSNPETVTTAHSPRMSTELRIPLTLTEPPAQITLRCSSMPLTLSDWPAATVAGAPGPTVRGRPGSARGESSRPPPPAMVGATGRSVPGSAFRATSTAINAATLVIAALIWNFDAVVFANERSADAPTLTTPDGRPVNHQFAKSHAFEQLLGDWIARYIADDLAVFSLLRRDSELAICREFAELTAYHDVFSSCNRNFHLDGPRTARWCGQCPKCRFVFLGLAPFMDVQRLEAIFGRDLLAEPGQADAFAELLELAGPRPFECVGEAGEARAALGALAADPRWCDHAVVRELMQRVRGIRLPDLASIVRPAGPDCIPGRFRR